MQVLLISVIRTAIDLDLLPYILDSATPLTVDQIAAKTGADRVLLGTPNLRVPLPTFSSNTNLTV
jgi:hypothetical protein